MTGENVRKNNRPNHFRSHRRKNQIDGPLSSFRTTGEMTGEYERFQNFVKNRRPGRIRSDCQQILRNVIRNIPGTDDEMTCLNGEDDSGKFPGRRMNERSTSYPPEIRIRWCFNVRPVLSGNDVHDIETGTRNGTQNAYAGRCRRRSCAKRRTRTSYVSLIRSNARRNRFREENEVHAEGIREIRHFEKPREKAKRARQGNDCERLRHRVTKRRVS